MLTTLVLIGPRAAILIWWLVDMQRWEAAFNSFWVALLGFIFLPWTTLMYVLVAPTGDVVGFDWVWLALALVLDIAMYTGGAYGNRNRGTTSAAY
jgi:hypothetical protein